MYLTLKETNKFKVISAVLEGQLKIGEAAKLLNLSQRQICRLKHRVKKRRRKGSYPQIKREKAATLAYSGNKE